MIQTKTFGQELQRLRTQAGVSVAEIAHSTGLFRDYLAKIELDREIASSSTIETLALYFKEAGIAVDDLTQLRSLAAQALAQRVRVRRPKSITILAGFIFISAAYSSLVALLLSVLVIVGNSDLLGVVLVMPLIVGLTVLQFKIGRGILGGANWARLAFLIVFAVAPIGAFMTSRNGIGTRPAISALFYLSGVWILSMPSSRRYFSERSR